MIPDFASIGALFIVVAGVFAYITDATVLERFKDAAPALIGAAAGVGVLVSVLTRLYVRVIEGLAKEQASIEATLGFLSRAPEPIREWVADRRKEAAADFSFAIAIALGSIAAYVIAPPAAFWPWTAAALLTVSFVTYFLKESVTRYLETLDVQTNWARESSDEERQEGHEVGR